MDFEQSKIIYQFAIAPAIPIIAAGVGLASQLFTNMFNKSQSDEANEITRQNNEFQQQAYLDERAYNRELQERIFNREDTSYQRTVDDIQKSGLSPLAINGTNNSGSVVSQATMPELNNINPFQAQQMNFGQLVDAIGQADSREIEREKNEIIKQRDLSDTQQKEADRAERAREADQLLEQRQAEARQTQENFVKEFGLEQSKQAKQAEKIDADINRLNELSKLEKSQYRDKKILETINQVSGGKGKVDEVKREKGESDEQYSKRVKDLQNAWWKSLSDVLEQKKYTLQFNPKSQSSGESKGLNAGATGFASVGGNFSEYKSKALESLEISNIDVQRFFAENAYPMEEIKL